MFKPKTYKSNNLEAYRLLSEDGSEFLYEDKVEYSEDRLFKDEQGRTYYLVTTSISEGKKYYVEVEPEGTPIPVQKEKDISDLMMTSPREPDSVPRNMFVKKPDEEVPAAPSPVAPEPESQAPKAEEPVPEAAPKDSCFESPEPKAMQEDKPQVTAPEKIELTDDARKLSEDAQAAFIALASLPEKKESTGKKQKMPKKKRSWVLPLIGLVIVAMIVVAAAGIYIYRPGLVTDLKSRFISGATPTPEPTAVPTAEPSIMPTPMPSPTPGSLSGGPGLYTSLGLIASAIQSDNQSVIWFASNHTNVAGGSYSRLAKACDLFDYVNKNWAITGNNDSAPQNAGTSVLTLKGTSKDYSVLMTSLTQSLGLQSRVVASYDGNTLYYYPEIMLAANDSSYNDAKMYLKSRYLNAYQADPYGHTQGSEHWLSMGMGKNPGIKVNSTDDYAVDSVGQIMRV